VCVTMRFVSAKRTGRGWGSLPMARLGSDSGEPDYLGVHPSRAGVTCEDSRTSYSLECGSIRQRKKDRAGLRKPADGAPR